jgi:hypothetical protein
MEKRDNSHLVFIAGIILVIVGIILIIIGSVLIFAYFSSLNNPEKPLISFNNTGKPSGVIPFYECYKWGVIIDDGPPRKCMLPDGTVIVEHIEQ